MNMQQLLDPKVDRAFRHVFGSEKNKDILIQFLNDMVVVKDRKPIVEVTFLETHQLPEIAAHKESIVDVLCEDEAHNKFIVEMQVERGSGFEKRAQYYAAKAYISQMEKGGDYADLKEVIFLAITNFTMFPQKKAYKSDHVTLDKLTHEHDLKGFSYTFLELPKFNKPQDELNTMIEKWAYYFKHAPDMRLSDIHTLFAKDITIQKAYTELDRFSWTEEELRTYDADLKRIWDNQAIMRYRAYQIKQAEQKGVEKGRKEGREEGREEGRDLEKLAIARNLIQTSLSDNEIAKITGLSVEKVRRLRH